MMFILSPAWMLVALFAILLRVFPSQYNNGQFLSRAILWISGVTLALIATFAQFELTLFGWVFASLPFLLSLIAFFLFPKRLKSRGFPVAFGAEDKEG